MRPSFAYIRTSKLNLRTSQIFFIFTARYDIPDEVMIEDHSMSKVKFVRLFPLVSIAITL